MAGIINKGMHLLSLYLNWICLKICPDFAYSWSCLFFNPECLTNNSYAWRKPNVNDFFPYHGKLPCTIKINELDLSVYFSCHNNDNNSGSMQYQRTVNHCIVTCYPCISSETIKGTSSDHMSKSKLTKLKWCSLSL